MGVDAHGKPKRKRPTQGTAAPLRRIRRRHETGEVSSLRPRELSADLIHLRPVSVRHSASSFCVPPRSSAGVLRDSPRGFFGSPANQRERPARNSPFIRQPKIGEKENPWKLLATVRQVLREWQCETLRHKKTALDNSRRFHSFCWWDNRLVLVRKWYELM